jgi:uncharacterized RDD family membrane protein YckC
MTDKRDKDNNEVDTPNAAGISEASRDDQSRTWKFTLKDNHLIDESPQDMALEKKLPAIKSKTNSRPEQANQTSKLFLDNSLESKRRGSFLKEKKDEQDYYVAKISSRIISGVVDLFQLFVIYKLTNMESVVIFSENLYFPIANIFDFANKVSESQLNLLLLTLNFIILSFLLYILPLLIFQRSLGKMILKIRIHYVMENTPSITNIFLREAIFKPLSILTLFGIGMIYFDDENRALHDRLGKTLVVKS